MSLFSKDVGIDLGTANTLVYMKGKGIIMREPSVVAVDTKSDEVRCVGAEAKAVIGRTPGSIVAVRPLKDGVIADLGVTVDVLGASSETAYDEQLSMIETTLSANDCDAMVVAPLQAETVATQIANTDLPIVAIDTAIDSDKVLSFVGFNNEELAAMGGKAAVEAAKDKGWDKITAIGIMGVQGDSTSEARIAGFKQGIAEAGGEYLSAETQYADSVADKAVTCMEAIIQAHPEGVSIIVANNDDMAAGAARAAAAFPAYKNTIFVGIGGNLAGIDAILAGQETMTVAVDGYDVGYLGVQAAVDALNGKKLDEFIATDATVVTADNAAERRAEVEKRLGQ